MKSALYISLPATLLAAAAFTALAPLEKILGANARLVYLHGAWVWAAMLLFLAAAGLGLAGLLLRRTSIHRWSAALGRTSLLLWIGFLPTSFYLMNANWNGLFLDEPRFRTPLNLAVVGLLLQVGLWFLPLSWASLGNLLYGLVFWAVMSGLESVLHPVSPILTSESNSIRIFFAILLVFLLAAGFQIAWLLKNLSNPQPAPP